MSDQAQPLDPEQPDSGQADAEENTSASPQGEQREQGEASDAIDAELVDILDGVAAEAEHVVTDLERVAQERDEYLDGFLRLQAEFENYKKAVAKRESDARSRANDSLVSELLPVLDACAMAAASGSEDVVRVQTALVDALTKQGLEVLDPAGAPFDPEHHEAVMHEDVAGLDGLVVAEVLRTGYGWKGHVIRPAMVKTQG